MSDTKSRNQRIAFMVRTRKISRKKAEQYVDRLIKEETELNQLRADANNLFGTSYRVKTPVISYVPPPVKSIILEYLGPMKSKKELEYEQIHAFFNYMDAMRVKNVEDVTRICLNVLQ